jgi:hypothetical protein
VHRATAPAVLLLLLAGLAAVPADAQADGKFAISPGRHDIADAQAGQSYLRSVQVQNEFDTPSTITVTTSGEAGAWTATQPASGFAIAARGSATVQLTVTVPPGAGPGNRTGWVNFTTEPKGASGGSGSSSLRFGAALALDVRVGGQAVERLVWLSSRVEDAPFGEPVHAFVRVRNEGNVRTLAEVAGAVLPFREDQPVLSSSTGSLEVVSGEEAEVAVTFPAGLALGQYRARLSADGFNETREFKVTAEGARAPAGELRSVTAEGPLRAGRTGTLLARFANTGTVDIGSATFHGEIRRDGGLVASVASPAAAVAAGANATLEVAWTPAEAGVYVLTGSVTYDGYESLPNEARLEVHPGAGTTGFPWWILLVLAALGIVLVLLWLSRRKAARPGGPR